MKDTKNYLKEFTPLFESFPAVSTTDWEKIITRDLKGADREKKLVFNSYDGFKVQPYYRAEDLKDLDYLKDSFPGAYPYLRGYNESTNKWEIRQEIFTADIEAANKEAVQALEHGATEICFNATVVNNTLTGVNVQNYKDFKKLLKFIDLSKTAVHFNFGAHSYMALELLIRYVKEHKINPKTVKGSTSIDLLGSLTESGNLGISEDNLFTKTANSLKLAMNELPNFQALTIDGNIFSNMGASNVQETALTVAKLTDYLARLEDKGIKTEELLSTTGISVAIGPDYFFEIAKFRALRYMISTTLKEFGVNDEEILKLPIHAKTTLWNKTIFDPNINMLRTTTEAMSAAIGGVNSLSVLPYDTTFKMPDTFSQRIARNTQIILQDEAGLDKIVDPAAGSYYLENLTHKIITATTDLFLKIEKAGGYLEALKKGIINDEISGVAEKKLKMVGARREVYLGTNQFPNLEETMLQKIDFQTSAIQSDTIFKDLGNESNALKISTLKITRGATAFEEIRLKTEKSGVRPKVFLWTQGNLTMRKARAGFVQNFFGCAGFEIRDNAGFTSIDEGMQAVTEYGADVVVICSSDDEYLELAAPITKAVKSKNPNAKVLIAGDPRANEEALRNAGIEDFVHLKTNAVSFLSSYQEKLGVK